MQRFDAATIHAWAQAARAGLAAARDRIDAINVFPVADGDTGTNVLLTVDGAVEALARAPRTGPAEPAARALARGALLAARGNSGVILSQYLVGLARALPAARDDLTTADLASALAAA
ncbi:DAK2 domain-containing protein, partial [Cellulomonas massiliensis]|uniref:DAK2 domain-containing protein n=1 Tax=Cellulomonas massiliensis TaxID=1465811 RepID=UPI001FE56952